MNEQIFKNNLRLIKQSRTKQSEKINHKKQQEFYRWLIENNLHKYLK